MHFPETWGAWPYSPRQTEKPRRQSPAQRASPAPPPGPQQSPGDSRPLRPKALASSCPAWDFTDSVNKKLHMFYSVTRKAHSDGSPHVSGVQKTQALREWASIIILDLLHGMYVSVLETKCESLISVTQVLHGN